MGARALDGKRWPRARVRLDRLWRVIAARLNGARVLGVGIAAIRGVSVSVFPRFDLASSTASRTGGHRRDRSFDARDLVSSGAGQIAPRTARRTTSARERG